MEFGTQQKELKPHKMCINDNLIWPWPIKQQGQLCSFRIFYLTSPFILSNIFSETNGPIDIRFNREHQFLAGTNVYIIGSGNMTKMAAVSIYGKSPFKISRSRTISQMTLKLGTQQKEFKPYRVRLIMTRCWPWPILQQHQLCLFRLSHLKIPSTLSNISSETTGPIGQMLYGISMPRGNKRLYNWSWSHDQDGLHAHIW